MEFRVLGPFEVSQRGKALALGAAQQRALLAILLTQANRVVSTDRLSELLWGDDAPATAEHMLAVYISNLRRILEPGAASYGILIRRSPGYLLEVGPEHLDAFRFENLVATAKHLPPEEKAAELTEALGLWRGPAYADFAFMPFALTEATRLNELRVHALEERIEAELASGGHREVIAELEALVAEFPLRERLSGQLMLALYRSGRQAEASSVYQQTRDRLVDEQGMEPGPELQSLLTRILKQDPGLGPQPELVERRSSNLPIQLTSFVGRQAELEEIGRMVKAFRIVTLVGSGGSGKTRLAVEIGTNLVDRFSGGVWFVDLSALTEGDFVVQAIASSLGIFEQPGLTLISTISEYLRARTVLLILDNCEHLVEAVAQATDGLVTRCPRLHVLATSRERLGVDGEHLHHLRSLSLPAGNSPGELDQSEAVQLFVERARLSMQSFSLTEQNSGTVAELCRRLDGTPLAIELAAARIPALGPSEILVRLGDQLGILASGARNRAPRQRSLRATLDWSYRLLDPDEAALFRRLAAFAGGFYLNAAEAVGSHESVKASEIAGVLARLCDRSLVFPDQRLDGPTRYRLLETVRAFSAGRLKEAGEDRAARGRHAAFYLELVKHAQAGIVGDQAQTWLDLMETEHDNARSALSWAVVEDRDLAIQLAVAWTPYWQLRRHLSEGRRWLAAVLEGQDEIRDWNDEPEAAYRIAEAELAAARIALTQADHQAAQSYAEKGLLIGQSLRDSAITAALLAELGLLAGWSGNPSLARSRLNQAMAFLRDAGADARVPAYGSGIALEAAINIALAQGSVWSRDYEEARRYFLRGLEFAERAGGRPLVSVSLGLGELALIDRDLPRARDYFAAALRIAVKLKDDVGICVSLAHAAALAAVSANPVSALRLQGASLILLERLGSSAVSRSLDRTVNPVLDGLHRKLGEGETQILLEAGRAMSESQAIDFAFTEVLGTVERRSQSREEGA